MLAKQESDCNVKNALNFALLEDFDHLYRYSNLLDYEYGVCPEKLVGGYTEIMFSSPGLRFPSTDIRKILFFHHIQNCEATVQTKLNIGIITAAEQQTMNYYMNGVFV